MRNYIILNGNNSNEITGLLIQSLPPISKPLMRTAIEEIDGKDGDIVTTLGYSAYDKELSIGLYGSYDVDEVIKYFNDNSKGQVTFSNEPDKYYNYEIINQIDFERLIRFKTATVTLHCQPFKYPTEETPVEIAYQYVNNEAEEMDLDNTADAPMEIDLKGNTQQDSTTGKNKIIPYSHTRTSGDFTFTSNEDGTITANGSASSSFASITNANAQSYLFTLQAGTYTLSGGYSSDLFIQLCDASGNSLANSKTTSGTFTISENTQVYYRAYINSGTSVSNVKMYIQLESGSSATEWERPTNGASPNPDYPQPIHVVSGDNTINVCGKNLFKEWISGTINPDTGVISSTARNLTNPIKVRPSTKYTMWREDTGFAMYAIEFDKNDNWLAKNTISSANTQLTFTTNANTDYVRLYQYTSFDTTKKAQLEVGESHTTYEAYTGQSQLISLGDIELCKIGDYQDYIYKSGDKWYLHKEIGKVVLDGSESWSSYNSTNKSATYRNTDLWSTNDYYDAISDYFVYYKAGQSSLTNGTFKIQNKQLYMCLANESSITDATGFQTWLSTHNTIVYYVLDTPTDTEITDTTLLEQLGNIANARSYDTSTHITQNANDKPFILNATALQKGSDTGIVDNDGNIYSKPTLDIEGTGTVAIYLNGNQMFSVDLSNSDECVIDITNLEAYDPETNELMNRQVTGDYSNFTLPVGENTVKVSGNVTKATITDYTRWL